MTDTPKVLVIGLNYAPEHTGIAPYTTGMVRALAEDAHVQVVTAHPHYPQWEIADGYGQWRRDEREGPVHVRRLRHYVPHHPTGVSRIVSEASFAARVLAARLRRPDLVIAVSPALLSVVAARMLGARWRVPVGGVVQDLYSRAMTEVGLLGGGAKPVTRLESAALRGADGLVAIHERFADSMVRGLGVDRDKISVIPNWTHVDPPQSDRRAVRRGLGWDDETVVLHAGNMGAKQGLELVIDAADAAWHEDPTIRFVLMGDGSQRPALERKAAGVPNIEIIDGVPNSQFSDVLSAADVLLLHERPGIEEMCVPSKLTSYFAAGRPVLAATSQRSAAAREIELSGAGVLVEPGAPDALVAGLSSLTQVHSLDEIGQRGQVYASEQLSERSSLDAYRNWAVRMIRTGRRQ